MFEIFQYDFMIRAFVAGVIVAIVAPLIGLFLVVRRYSYLADTLAHVSLVGVAVGLLANVNPIFSALAVSVISAWWMERIRATRKFIGESILAIFLSGSLAVALLLIGLGKRFSQDLFSFLFGSVTTVGLREVYTIGALGFLIAASVILLYKELFLVSLHEEIAQAEGLNTRSLNLFLIVVAAVSVSVAMRIVGVLLIGALMVIPVVTAMQFSRSFKHTLVASVLISLFATTVGLVVSFYADLPSGATIVVVALLGLAWALTFNKKS